MRILSDDDLAAVTILGEAEGEPQSGKVAVGEVIRNRTRRGYFSNGTVADTVLRPLQFSCWNATSPRRDRMLTVDDEEVVFKACLLAWETSETSNLTNGAVLYLNPRTLRGVLPTWADPAKRVASIENHDFYASAGAA